MRPTRAYLAGLGTAGSLVLCTAVLFVLGSAVVTFDGWPQLSTPPAPATQVVDAQPAGVASAVRPTAAVTVPAPPRAPRGGVRRAAAAAPAAPAAPSPAAGGGRAEPVRIVVAAPPVRRCAAGCAVHRPRPAGGGRSSGGGTPQAGGPATAPAPAPAPAPAIAPVAPATPVAPVVTAPAPVQVAATVPVPAPVPAAVSGAVEARVGPVDATVSVDGAGVAGHVAVGTARGPLPLPVQP